MSPGNLEELLQHAILSTDAFVDVLGTENLPGWASRFSAIASMLRDGDIRGALHNYRNCQFGGPGSLSDVFANDQRSFDKAWATCGSSLRALSKA